MDTCTGSPVLPSQSGTPHSLGVSHISLTERAPPNVKFDSKPASPAPKPASPAPKPASPAPKPASPAFETASPRSQTRESCAQTRESCAQTRESCAPDRESCAQDRESCAQDREFCVRVVRPGIWFASAGFTGVGAGRILRCRFSLSRALLRRVASRSRPRCDLCGVFGPRPLTTSLSRHLGQEIRAGCACPPFAPPRPPNNPFVRSGFSLRTGVCIRTRFIGRMSDPSAIIWV